MASIGGSNVVKSGLVLSLDAANARSYPGSGTTWRDLSGNNNTFTLTNGPTFDSANGGSIFTDGTNDYIASSYFGNTADSFTFSVWFKNDNYSEDKAPLARGRDGFGNGWSIALGITTSGISQSGVVTTSGGATQFSAVGTSILALNTWCYLTGVWTAGVSIKHYVNGVLEATTNTSSTNLRTSTQGWVIGNLNASFTSGYNAIAQIYNRVLSDTEIAQNFNATKGRFNL
jgi:hypothetical protein